MPGRAAARTRGGVVARALALVAAWGAAGAVVGVCAAVLGTWWWGLLLGVSASLATAVAAPAGRRGRVPFALGWAVIVLRLALRRPEGDYVVAGDVGGYVLLGLGVALVVGSLVTVPPRCAAKTESEPGPGPPSS